MNILSLIDFCNHLTDFLVKWHKFVANTCLSNLYQDRYDSLLVSERVDLGAYLEKVFVFYKFDVIVGISHFEYMLFEIYLEDIYHKFCLLFSSKIINGLLDQLFHLLKSSAHLVSEFEIKMVSIKDYVKTYLKKIVLMN